MLSSPVSRWPAWARAYLAAVLMLMLILTAAHFAIQVWGQTQARQWVHAWEKQYDGHVGHVRLRMLRGALTLSDVAWHSGNVSFQTPYLLLRGNLSDASEHVEIREIDMRGGKFVLPRGMLQHILIDKDVQAWLPWNVLLKDLRKVRGRGFTLMLGEDGQISSYGHGLVLKHILFSGEPTQKRWHMAGKLFTGHVEITHQPQQTDVIWKDVDSRRFFSSFGLLGLKGLVSGSSSWNGKDWSGNVHWRAEKESSELGKLAWRAAINQGQWQADVHSVHWPLHVFSAYVPSIAGHTLQSAYLKGLVKLTVNKQGWQLNAQEGSLSNILYQHDDKPLWQFEKVSFSQAEMRWPQRDMRVKEINIQGGIGAIHINKVESSKPEPAWHVNLSNIAFSQMKYGDIGHDFWIPALAGKASLTNHLFKAKAESDTTVMGQWQIELSGKPHALNIKAHASGVPLLAFRDKIPSRLSEGAGLSGLVELELQGLWGDEQWHMQGYTNAHDVVWNRGAWLWKAKRMSLRNMYFGSSGDVKVGDWQINDWSGQASLQPWTGISVNEATDKKEPFWLQGWQVAALTAKHGTFSLGKEDAVWLHAREISLKPIHQEKTIRMKILGKLADGNLWVNAHWFPWGDAPWFTLKAALKNALPFVAEAWLKVSGLPAFTKGRVSARLNVQSVKKSKDDYKGLLNVSLRNAGIEQGVFSNQLFSQATGYAPDALFERIAPNGDVDVSVSMNGNWNTSPLNWKKMGASLLETLANKTSAVSKGHKEKQSVHLSNIRLHTIQQGENDSLKHNERVRLRKVLSVLRREKTWRLELVPQLGNATLNDTLLARVHYTQKQIEQFLIARGISSGRIFPVLPEESNRQGTSTGILIQAVK